MSNSKNWKELKVALVAATEEIESDNYEQLNSLYEEIQKYFGKNNFTEKELVEAKEIVKLISEKINSKIDSYNAELETNGQKKKGFIQYLNNINLPL